MRCRMASTAGVLRGLATNTCVSQAAHLEHMEGFQLNVATAVTQRVHDALQICGAGHKAHHGGIVRAVHQNLAQELERLAPRYVVVRVQQLHVHAKEGVVALLQKLSSHGAVQHQRIAQVLEGVAGDAKGRRFNVHGPLGQSA